MLPALVALLLAAPSIWTRPNTVPNLNLANPLVKNLVLLALPEYGDLVSRNTTQVTGTASITSGPYGKQVTNTAALTSMTGGLTANYLGGPKYFAIEKQSGAGNIAWTMIVYGTITGGNASNFSSICGVGAQTGNSFTNNSGMQFFFDNQVADCQGATGGTETGATSNTGFLDATILNTGPHVWAVSRGGGHYNFYLDGRPWGTPADSNPTVATFIGAAALRPWSLLSGDQGGRLSAQGNIFLGAIFDRALTPSEHVRLAASPMDLVDYNQDLSWLMAGIIVTAPIPDVTACASNLPANCPKQTGTTGSSITSNSFSTGNAVELICALTSQQGVGNTATTITDSGLTLSTAWTKIGQCNNSTTTDAEIWCAVTSATAGANTVTATFTATAVASSTLTVVPFSTSETVLPTNYVCATNTSGAAVLTLTTIAATSGIYGGGTDTADTTARTPTTGATILNPQAGTTGYVWSEYANPNAVGSQSFGTTAPTSTLWGLDAVEVLYTNPSSAFFTPMRRTRGVGP